MVNQNEQRSVTGEKIKQSSDIARESLLPSLDRLGRAVGDVSANLEGLQESIRDLQADLERWLCALPEMEASAGNALDPQVAPLDTTAFEEVEAVEAGPGLRPVPIFPVRVEDGAAEPLMDNLAAAALAYGIAGQASDDAEQAMEAPPAAAAPEEADVQPWEASEHADAGVVESADDATAQRDGFEAVTLEEGFEVAAGEEVKEASNLDAAVDPYARGGAKEAAAPEEDVQYTMRDAGDEASPLEEAEAGPLEASPPGGEDHRDTVLDADGAIQWEESSPSWNPEPAGDADAAPRAWPAISDDIYGARTEQPAEPDPAAEAQSETEPGPVGEVVAAAQTDDEREAVRRAVEEMRRELSGEPDTSGGSGAAQGPGDAVSEEDPSRELEEAGMAVEEARADLEAPELDAPPQEEPLREEVRRAVEEARADMQEPDAPSGEGEEPEGRSILVASMMGAEGKFSDQTSLSTPLMVIEDPEGRAELVQVFDTLARVDRAAQAALLSYSPHRITLGLSSLSTPPDPQALARAASEVFAAECNVTKKDSEITISVGRRRAA